VSDEQSLGDPQVFQQPHNIGGVKVKRVRAVARATPPVTAEVAGYYRITPRKMRYLVFPELTVVAGTV